MDPITAISQVGSLLKATRSVMEGVAHRSEKASSSTFANYLQQAGVNSEMTTRLIQALDTDKNGTLSLDEVNAAAQIFTKIDADGNGQITQAELAQFLARPAGGPQAARGV